MASTRSEQRTCLTCLTTPSLAARLQLNGYPPGKLPPSFVLHAVWAPIQPTGVPQVPGIADPVLVLPLFSRSS